MNYEIGTGCSQNNNCSGLYNCPSDRFTDFCIKRYDTAPSLKMSVENYDDSLDFSQGNFELKVSIWLNCKLKKNITDSETEIQLADNIGFHQIALNNVLVLNRARNPEKLLVTGFVESENKIVVQRGYDSTTPQAWNKGNSITAFRVIDDDAEIELVLEDVTKEDGTIIQDEVVDTLFTYNWSEEATSLPGCYFLEFKLTEYEEGTSDVISIRKVPVQNEGLLIGVLDSPTES
jgi:hypothetical protein